MSLSGRERLFAYATNTAGECACPAVAAECFDHDADYTKHPVAPVIEAYDEIVDEKVRRGVGYAGEHTVTESVARDAWLEAIAELTDSPVDHTESIAAGEAVAHELGWLEDDV